MSDIHSYLLMDSEGIMQLSTEGLIATSLIDPNESP